MRTHYRQFRNSTDDAVCRASRIFHLSDCLAPVARGYSTGGEKVGVKSWNGDRPHHVSETVICDTVVRIVGSAKPTGRTRYKSATTPLDVDVGVTPG